MTDALIDPRLKWIKELENLANGNLPSLRTAILAEIAPRQVFKAKATTLSRGFSDFRSQSPQVETTQTIDIPQSNLTTEPINQLRSWFRKHLGDDIAHVVLHGSLGTEEVVPYSDVDALVLLKDETIESPNRLAHACLRLFQAQKFMRLIDPLQHHGWFVLPSSALAAWPESYLPVETLRHSSSMFVGQSMEVGILQHDRSGSAAWTTLQSLFEQTRADIESRRYARNLYFLKSMISKILLLPAVYVQARDGVGVFKKDSFDSAQPDFSDPAWRFISAASDIRSRWPQVEPLRPRMWGCRPGPLGNLVRKRFSKPIEATLLKDAEAQVCASFDIFRQEAEQNLSRIRVGGQSA